MDIKTRKIIENTEKDLDKANKVIKETEELIKRIDNLLEKVDRQNKKLMKKNIEMNTIFVRQPFCVNSIFFTGRSSYLKKASYCQITIKNILKQEKSLI